MTRTHKYDEVTKVISVRVPGSQVDHYKKVVVRAVENEYKGITNTAKFLYDLMSEGMIFKDDFTVSDAVLERIREIKEMIE